MLILSGWWRYAKQFGKCSQPFGSVVALCALFCYEGYMVYQRQWRYDDSDGDNSWKIDFEYSTSDTEVISLVRMDIYSFNGWQSRSGWNNYKSCYLTGEYIYSPEDGCWKSSTRFKVFNKCGDSLSTWLVDDKKDEKLILRLRTSDLQIFFDEMDIDWYPWPPIQRLKVMMSYLESRLRLRLEFNNQQYYIWNERIRAQWFFVMIGDDHPSSFNLWINGEILEWNACHRIRLSLKSDGYMRKIELVSTRR